MSEYRGRLERLWRHQGLWCMVAGGYMTGFRTGYVMAPEDHPWHLKSYDDIEASVHGGLTFAGMASWDEVLEHHDGIPRGWWVGFDCGHFGDAPDIDLARDGIPASYILAWGNGRVWSTEEVVDEVEILATQAHAAGVLEAMGRQLTT